MEEKEQLVSIIVRTKDRPKLLKNAIKSISEQTYERIEVVLVNDGGCDLNVEELKDMLGDMPLNYIRLDKNTGRAHAGNVGIENIKGDYIGFLDDDDEYYPEHVETLVTFLEQNYYKVAYSDSLMVYSEVDHQTIESIDVRKELLFSKDFDYDYLFFENYIPFMCLLFSKEVIRNSGGFDIKLEIYEDWDLLIRIGDINPLCHIAKVTANYNQWCSDQQISQRNKDFNFIEQSYLKILSKHKHKITEKRIRHYISQFINARESLRDPHMQAEYLKRTIKECEYKIKTLEETIQTIQEENDLTLNIIHNSGGYRALLIYYRIRDSLFPSDSRRRLFVKLFIFAVKNRKEFFASLNRNNVRKFLAQYSTLDPALIESKVARKVSLHSTGFQKSQNEQILSEVTFDEDDLFSDSMMLGSPHGRDRILIIDRFVPTYDKDSGSLRMFSLMEILNDLGYKITFLPDDMLKREPYTNRIKKMGIEVLYGKIDVEEYLRRKGHLFSFVLISRPEQMFKYITLMRAYAVNSTLIYDTVDLHWLRFERTVSVTGNKELKEQVKYYQSMELFNAACSDIIFTVTEEEKNILLGKTPELKIEVVPNIHNVIRVDSPFQRRKDMLFIGGFSHQPNEDAVFYFVKEIFPIIKERIKGVKFIIVGSDPSPALLNLESEDIVITGYVEDVMPYFAHCRVFVSPLRYGAGMKGKIGQSMAFGLPVVTTTVGAEGIGLVDGENSLISDDPQIFAKAVIRLYTDEFLWTKISEKSLLHIEKNFSRKTVGKKLADFFNSIETEQEEIQKISHS